MKPERYPLLPVSMPVRSRRCLVHGGVHYVGAKYRSKISAHFAEDTVFHHTPLLYEGA